ncbi:MAG: porin [Antarcticimicrobium sp.]|uniref:porin n=1 Tax=Antarcticimicrobium sp. TaxID=2824147 RepID=UPI002619B375|nr:porin [Antarcticimicrobium sp.]MDF1717031.1 porin [Antarcticimicrobium sp.]
MKKVLFATTALIATAGMAAAEVRISGYGRFGVDYNDGADAGLAGLGDYPGGRGPSRGNDTAVNGVSSTTITSRLRLQFDMSTETDGGVALGGRFRAQANSGNNVAGGAAFNGARFFASYGGFTLMVGNILGAIENTTGLYLETKSAGTGVDGSNFVSLVTNVNNEYFDWDAYSSGGAGANGVEVLYSSGAFNGHISYSQRNVAPGGYYGLVAGETQHSRVGANVSYTFGNWTGALGFQDSTALFEDKVLVTLQGDLGQYGVRMAYADNDGINKWGLYGNMDIGAASNLLVWVTDEEAVSAADVVAGRGDNRDAVAGSNQEEGTSYGIHYSYDLGGGASFEAGYREASNGNTTVQAGVFFSF